MLKSQIDRLQILDEKITEFSSEPRYKEKCAILCCLRDVQTLTAMTVLCELGDLTRFETPRQLSAYLGLTLSEYSSGGKECKGGITKHRNSTVRLALVEAAQTICKGKVGVKGKALKLRQHGSDPHTIAYADACGIRLQKRYYRILLKAKKRNIAVTDVARELTCFIWGLLTNNMTLRIANA